MTKILSIDNQAGTVLVNLIDDSATCVFIGEGGERPLKGTGGLVTRTFTFRTTASTKALARTAANTFIDSLRKAITWHDDDLETNSIFLREAADGETAVRSLIVDFDATAVSDGSAIDAYQTMNIQLYIDVALTLQNHREEASKTAGTIANASTAQAIGHSFTLSVLDHTKPSRTLWDINGDTAAGTGVESDVLTRLWVGVMPYTGSDFVPIWLLQDADLHNNTSLTTDADMYDTNVAEVSNADFTATPGMALRVSLDVATVYTGAFIGPLAYAQAKGNYVALLRYKLTGAGTVLARGGVSYSSSGTYAYNEPRVLEDSGEWRFVNLGLVKIPPRGYRYEKQQIFSSGFDHLIGDTSIGVDAQRITGSGVLLLDTITMIPFYSYIALENVKLSNIFDTDILTYENLIPEAVSRKYNRSTLETYCNIVGINNWMLPIIRGTYLQVVLAAEREDEQVHDDPVAVSSVSVFKAYEGYHA